ncbi:MAG TPA: hypothetical protein DDX05_01380 [Deltaproteobacteria bacterium]|nr:MAG: hypothetical protein A2X90_06095 [Deltaproteobacteria bacterium GWA2_65_63]OGP27247.1 MAG: hypothetical protein A2X91_08200 [Deltaproteobacteria bacterium GWB2_65_81]OGP39584.1 MAG: hypothetical protein A2X98_00845 [Deltaproteobacteria bacterium GWC2_66_88]OGP77730.1 MAG: hypothetical protein A2Z26_02115 [Deltaproteobacteria bacterium RBG_16_66_15]HAM33139.1 hypothetical protein [Deltaproteobacteria bacterium]
MPLIGSILLATLVVSSISLVGILFTGLKESPPDRLLEYFVSFAAGGLLGGAFLHLLPEADGSPGFSSAGGSWGRRCRRSSGSATRARQSFASPQVSHAIRGPFHRGHQK